MNHAFSSPTLSKYPDIIQGTSSKYFWPLSFSYCKNTNKVIIDRVQFLDSLGLDATHSVLVCEQNHTSNIIEINEEKIGHGLFDQTSQIPNADGMITHIPNINLVIYTADCMPISFYDPVKKIIGVAHSGWKWTIADISKKMLLLMVSKYWCNITDILVSVGPSIGPCCYEVQNLNKSNYFKKNMEIFWNIIIRNMLISGIVLNKISSRYEFQEKILKTEKSVPLVTIIPMLLIEQIIRIQQQIWQLFV